MWYKPVADPDLKLRIRRGRFCFICPIGKRNIIKNSSLDPLFCVIWHSYCHLNHVGGWEGEDSLYGSTGDNSSSFFVCSTLNPPGCSYAEHWRCSMWIKRKSSNTYWSRIKLVSFWGASICDIFKSRVGVGIRSAIGPVVKEDASWYSKW